MATATTTVTATATTLHQHAHSINGMPHGLGLLTTVASLPPKYRSRYLNIKTRCEVPLDLSVKQISPQIAIDVPIATSFAEVYTEPTPPPSATIEATESTATAVMARSASPMAILMESRANKQSTNTIAATTAPLKTTKTMATVTITKISKPITPPLTPTPITTTTPTLTPSPTPTPTPTSMKRKQAEHCADGVDENDDGGGDIVERFIAEHYTNPPKMAKTAAQPTTKRECTPAKPIRAPETAPRTSKTHPQSVAPSGKTSKNKATRKLKFDEETSSPVSGTIIRPLEDITDGTMQYSNGDIDPKYNIVEITEETKAELAAIRNVIGDYVCKLCRIRFDDAFGLARHRCACIVLLEYRCPECGKQFNCPANLASHRRWHKPKKEAAAAGPKKENRSTTQPTTLPAVTTTTNTTSSNNNSHKSKSEELAYGCSECGKKFKRQAYLRKHQLTHAKKANANTAAGKRQAVALSDDIVTSSSMAVSVPYGTSSSSATASLRSSSSSSSASSSSSSSASSMHSYNAHDDEMGGSSHAYNASATDADAVAVAAHNYDYDGDSMSDCSTSSAGYGRLQIVESGLTEEENIAAAALTNLRNCASVIQHTTLAH